jgi:hypothetical protein
MPGTKKSHPPKKTYKTTTPHRPLIIPTKPSTHDMQLLNDHLIIYWGNDGNIITLVANRSHPTTTTLRLLPLAQQRRYLIGCSMQTKF